MATLEDKSLWETTPDEELLGADIMKASTEEINNRTRLLDNDIKVLKGMPGVGLEKLSAETLVQSWDVCVIHSLEIGSLTLLLYSPPLCLLWNSGYEERE